MAHNGALQVNEVIRNTNLRYFATSWTTSEQQAFVAKNNEPTKYDKQSHRDTISEKPLCPLSLMFLFCFYKNCLIFKLEEAKSFVGKRDKNFVYHCNPRENNKNDCIFKNKAWKAAMTWRNSEKTSKQQVSFLKWDRNFI